MNIIKKIHFIWKAWKRTLSIEEFSFLVGLVDDEFVEITRERRFAEKLLMYYFKGNLRQEEADILVHSQISSQQLWLNAIDGKTLTDIEYELLVIRFPWYFLWKFPTKLPYEYLEMLFAERNPLKIIAYCKSFDLPDEFEKKLLKNYKLSLVKPDTKMQYSRFGSQIVNGWAVALEEYLSSYCNKGQFISVEMQRHILSLNNANLTNALVKRCTIAENPLDCTAILRLVKDHNEKALRLLLSNSFLPNIPALLTEITQEMPELTSAVNIAQHRHKMYLLERKKGILLGASYFSPFEIRIILKYEEKVEIGESEFVELYIKPWLGRFGTCMSAQIAYLFPYLADDIWKALDPDKKQ